MGDLEVDAAEVWSKLREEYEMFPSRCCGIAVRELYFRGYEIVSGYVCLDNYRGMGKDKKIFHYWNRCSETDVEFDITASQFNVHLSRDRKLGDIEIWEDEHDVYEKERVRLSPGQVLFGR